MTTIKMYHDAITPISNEIKLALEQAINHKTKPLASLGALELSLIHI